MGGSNDDAIPTWPGRSRPYRTRRRADLGDPGQAGAKPSAAHGARPRGAPVSGRGRQGAVARRRPLAGESCRHRTVRTERAVHRHRPYSTGLGCPHLETDPDFLGLMVAFQTRGGQRVDFLTINDPTSPTDTHPQFVTLLDATADAAGAEPAFGSGVGQLDLANLAASNLRLIASLKASLGIVQGLKTATHVAKQTSRTALSSTAYQTYWTGIVEAGGVLGKFTFVPTSDDNHLRALTPGERHLSVEWRQRQSRGDIVFTLQWLPFIDEQSTSTRSEERRVG